jgi:hypothetical protein
MGVINVFIDGCNFSTLDNQLNLFIFYNYIAKDQEKLSYQLQLIEGNSINDMASSIYNPLVLPFLSKLSKILLMLTLSSTLNNKYNSLSKISED